MRGYPFQGNPEGPKEGQVVIDGIKVGTVSVRTAATEVFEKILLVRRSAAAGLRALFSFFEQTHATFPENPGDVHGLVHGVIFDAAEYVYHRYDAASQDIIFRPLKTDVVDTTPAPDPETVQGGDKVEPPLTPDEEDGLPLAGDITGGDIPTQEDKDRAITDYDAAVQAGRGTRLVAGDFRNRTPQDFGPWKTWHRL